MGCAGGRIERSAAAQRVLTQIQIRGPAGWNSQERLGNQIPDEFRDRAYEGHRNLFGRYRMQLGVPAMRMVGETGFEPATPCTPLRKKEKFGLSLPV